MSSSLQAVFQELRAILAKHTSGLHVTHDSDVHYSVNSKRTDAKGNPGFFGAVKVGSGRVTFHLMPIYIHPDLLAGMSEELAARMQGKSCFNFRSVDAELFRELERLTRKSAKADQQDARRLSQQKTR